LPGLVVTVPPGGSGSAEPRPAQKAAPAPSKSTKTRVPSKQKSRSAALDSSGSGKSAGSTQSIVVLVNDDPITAYEVEQRSRLMAMSANVSDKAQETFKRLVQQESTTQRLRAILQETIQANQGKSREQILAIFEEKKKDFAQNLQRQALDSAKSALLPTYKKQALEELIEERLKLQEAARISVTADDSQVDTLIKNIAERNKMTPEQFAQHLKSTGADIQSMRSRFKATLSWNQVVRRRFSAQVSVNQREIDRMISSSSEEMEDEVELTLHRITLPMPAKMDQAVMAKRLEDADQIMRSYKGCNSSAALAKAQNAKFENLGARKPSSVPEPTRSLLLNAKPGEMVPPNMSAQGIELYALCSRNVTSADDKKREQVAHELQQKEFEVLARRHLRDLRQDAHIEYR
jgi:peptidyl-prolyl cis-trans isomerase SurA